MDCNNLSFEQKMGQRFIFGINSDNVDCIINLIKECYIGGVILYKKNYNSYQEMVDVIKKFKKANEKNEIPLFIAIDQEGGKVNRMPKEIHNIKNIYDVSKSNDDLVGDVAALIDLMLSDSGININFAPVIDIYNNSNSKALFKRCFYGDYLDVVKSEKKYFEATNNIISVVKHYPGHGASIFDSHFFVPFVFDYKSILNKHIIPFEEAIKSGVPAIMVGHLVVRNLTGGLPASISKSFIDNYLKINYDGLIITDEINMLKRNLIYNLFYLRKALMSSSDIILIKIKDYSEGKMIIDKYTSILKENIKCSESLDDSVKNIVRVKKKFNITDNTDYIGVNVDNINKKIDEINNKIVCN